MTVDDWAAMALEIRCEKQDGSLVVYQASVTSVSETLVRFEHKPIWLAPGDSMVYTWRIPEAGDS